MNDATFTLRLIEWEKAKASMRCVLHMIHDEEHNAEANRIYSKFVEGFTKEIR